MASPLVFFHHENDLITLSCTENITMSRSAVVSKNTLQSGVTVSDHYHSGRPTVNITGIITDSGIRREYVTPSVKEYRELVDKVIDSAKPFTLYYGGLDEHIPNLDNCVISNYSFIKGGWNSLEVSITFEQLDFGMKGEKDTLTHIVVPAKITDKQLESTLEKGTGTKTEIPTTQALRQSKGGGSIATVFTDLFYDRGEISSGS